MKIIEKAIPWVSFLISLFIGLLVVQWINPDAFIKEKGSPVTMEEILKNPTANFTGKIAGADIPKLSGAGAFNTMNVPPQYGTQYENQYVTATPLKVIATGIGSRNSWDNPYEVMGNYRRGRYVLPEVNTIPIFFLGSYQEYYLIELPDGTYILAQFSDIYRQAVNRGTKVTLPIGIKKPNNALEKSYLKTVCEKYDAPVDFSLYMVDDAWYEEHDLLLLLIKFGCGAAVCFGLTLGLLTIEEIVKKRRTHEEHNDDENS